MSICLVLVVPICIFTGMFLPVVFFLSAETSCSCHVLLFYVQSIETVHLKRLSLCSFKKKTQLYQVVIFCCHSKNVEYLIVINLYIIRI